MTLRRLFYALIDFDIGAVIVAFLESIMALVICGLVLGIVSLLLLTQSGLVLAGLFTFAFMIFGIALLLGLISQEQVNTALRSFRGLFGGVGSRPRPSPEPPPPPLQSTGPPRAGPEDPWGEW